MIVYQSLSFVVVATAWKLTCNLNEHSLLKESAEWLKCTRALGRFFLSRIMLCFFFFCFCSLIGNLWAVATQSYQHCCSFYSLSSATVLIPLNAKPLTKPLNSPSSLALLLHFSQRSATASLSYNKANSLSYWEISLICSLAVSDEKTKKKNCSRRRPVSFVWHKDWRKWQQLAGLGPQRKEIKLKAPLRLSKGATIIRLYFKQVAI